MDCRSRPGAPGATCSSFGVRLVALLLAALAALAGDAAAARASPQIEDVAAAASVGSATVTWRTSVPTRGRVVYGVGGLYLYSARESTSATTHAVVLSDLSPATTYAFEIVAATATATGTLTTAAPPADLRFGVDGTHVTANGSLFFPVLTYYQCGASAETAASVGVNLFVEAPYTGCVQTNPNDFEADPPPAGISVLGDDFGSSQGAAAGWYLPDEPDASGLSPAQLPQLPAAAQTGRLRVLNLSQHFFSGQAPINAGFDRNDYKGFAAQADVVGFDMYPVVKFCGRVSLLDVFRAQRELATIYAPGKPTFQWIETGAMTGECETMQVTPQIVNAETWLAIAGGACGIGYFTSSWTGALWNRWDLAPGVEAQLARTIAQIRALAPMLCGGPPGEVTVPWDGPVAATSRSWNGAVYVIAVNSSDRSISVPFRVDALAGRALDVLGEGRTIVPAKQVYYRDSFAPYQVHVYLAAPQD
jgi:hypothetical protein